MRKEAILSPWRINVVNRFDRSSKVYQKKIAPMLLIYTSHIYIISTRIIENNIHPRYHHYRDRLHRPPSLSTRKIKRNVCLTIHVEESNSCDFHPRPFAFFFSYVQDSFHPVDQNFRDIDFYRYLLIHSRTHSNKRSSIIFSFFRSHISFF